MRPPRHTFGVVDYCVFGVTLAFSAGVGMFFALRGRAKAKANDMFTGGGHMQVLPTALSLMTSFLSGVTLLSVPAETYKRGILYWFSRLVGTMVATAVAVWIVLPILFEFRPTSVYEYFEARFRSKFLRKAGAVLYLLFMIAYMGVVLYAPSLALSSITKLKPWIFYLAVGMVCVVYTSFGGLKAVVWTDTFQAVCMIVGLGTLFVKGLIDNGGIGKTYELNLEYGRFDGIKNWSFDPFQYMTGWTSIFGGTAFWFTLITFNQISVQRYFAMPNMRQAQKVLLTALPGYMVLMVLADLSGLIIFAYYFGCDPLRDGSVEKPDQLVIYYALDVIGGYTGLPGIFLACLFSGTLSTVSSGINSMAAVLWEDFIAEHVPEMTEKRKLVWVTVIAFGFGFISIATAALSGPVGGVLGMVMSVMGAIGGPICGLFILGMLFPQANRYGATIGLGFSVVITGWISIGNIVLKPYKSYSLESPVDRCNSSGPFGNISLDSTPYYGGLKQIYTLSEVFYPALGIILVLLIGWPVSLLWKDKRPPHDWEDHEKETLGYRPRLCITEFFQKGGAPSGTHGDLDHPSSPVYVVPTPAKGQPASKDTLSDAGHHNGLEYKGPKRRVYHVQQSESQV